MFPIKRRQKLPFNATGGWAEVVRAPPLPTVTHTEKRFHKNKNVTFQFMNTGFVCDFQSAYHE